MKAKWTIFILTISVVSAWNPADAKYVEAPLKNKVVSSRIIAIVKVREQISDNPPGQFRHSASVEVLNSIKGAAVGDLLTIDFDSDFRCDDVVYSTDEECLVFLYK